MLQNSDKNYGAFSKAIHWITAAIILCLIVEGIYMAGLPDEAEGRMVFYNLHKSLGVLTILLLVVRFAWLKKSPAPELPAAFGNGERKLMVGARSVLYILMLLIPLSGYVMSTAAGYPVPFFGLFNMPALFGKNEALAGFAHEAHWIMGYTILAVVILHVAGVVKHRLADKGGETDVLARML